MARSATGMNRAAQEGRYTGGIVPLGYLVEGRKQHARLVPSDKLIWGNWTEADLVRQIYHWLAIEGWSCPRIAEHLNILGFPPPTPKMTGCSEGDNSRSGLKVCGVPVESAIW